MYDSRAKKCLELKNANKCQIDPFELLTNTLQKTRDPHHLVLVETREDQLYYQRLNDQINMKASVDLNFDLKFSNHRIRFCNYEFDKSKRTQINASIEKLEFLNRKLLKQKTPATENLINEIETLIKSVTKREGIIQEDVLKRLKSYLSLDKDDKICTNELTKFLTNFKTIDQDKISTYIKNYVLQSNSFKSLSNEDLSRKNIVIGLLNKNNARIDDSKEFLIYTSRHGLINYVFDPINVFYLLENSSNNKHFEKICLKLKENYLKDWNDFKSDTNLKEMLQAVINYFSDEFKAYFVEKLKVSSYLEKLEKENRQNQYRYFDAKKKTPIENKKRINFLIPDVSLEYSNLILNTDGDGDLIIFSHRILCDEKFHGYEIENECTNESCYFKDISDKTNLSR